MCRELVVAADYSQYPQHRPAADLKASDRPLTPEEVQWLFEAYNARQTPFPPCYYMPREQRRDVLRAMGTPTAVSGPLAELADAPASNPGAAA